MNDLSFELGIDESTDEDFIFSALIRQLMGDLHPPDAGFKDFVIMVPVGAKQCDYHFP